VRPPNPAPIMTIRSLPGDVAAGLRSIVSASFHAPVHLITIHWPPARSPVARTRAPSLPARRLPAATRF
jgi:hypothetical protein